jgi:hypothetical protein
MAIRMIVASNARRRRAGRFQRRLAALRRIALDGSIDLETLNSLEQLPGTSCCRTPDGRHPITDLPDQSWQNATIRSPRLRKPEGRPGPAQGSWPGRDEFVLANQIDSFGTPGLGETIFFKVNDRERAYTVEGVGRDQTVLAAPFEEVATFYLSAETFAALAGYDRYSQVRITVAEYSEEAVQEAADQIDRALRRTGVAVGFVQPTDPADHPAQATMDGVGLILTIMAAASLTLSSFLIVNATP